MTRSKILCCHGPAAGPHLTRLPAGSLHSPPANNAWRRPGRRPGTGAMNMGVWETGEEEEVEGGRQQEAAAAALGFVIRTPQAEAE